MSNALFIAILLLIMGTVSPLIGQTSKDSVSYSYFSGARFSGGFTINESIPKLQNSNPLSVHFEWSRLENSRKVWNQCGCYMRNGLSISYFNFSNPSVLGKAVNLTVFTEPYLTFSKRLKLSVRGGVGFSYLNNVYQPVSNPDNLLYSSHISFLLLLSPQLSYPLTPRLQLNVVTQISHISNGGSQWPNYGMNTMLSGVGLDYIINPPALKRRLLPPMEGKKIKKMGQLFTARRTADAVNTFPKEVRMVLGAQMGIMRMLSESTALGLALKFIMMELILSISPGQASNFMRSKHPYLSNIIYL